MNINGIRRNSNRNQKVSSVIPSRASRMHSFHLLQSSIENEIFFKCAFPYPMRSMDSIDRIEREMVYSKSLADNRCSPRECIREYWIFGNECEGTSSGFIAVDIHCGNAKISSTLKYDHNMSIHGIDCSSCIERSGRYRVVWIRRHQLAS